MMRRSGILRKHTPKSVRASLRGSSNTRTLHPTQGRTPRLRALLESGLTLTARPQISPDQHLKHPGATTRTVMAQVPRPEMKLATPGICSARLGSPELFSERLNLNLT